MANFVRASSIAHGQRGTSMVLYFTPPGNQQTLVARQVRHVIARLYLPAPKPTKVNAKITNQKNVDPTNSEPVSSLSAGSPDSSDLFGSTTGTDVRPAIELSNVDPPVSRTDIPAGVQGEVIVEITIDESGNVIGTKLLKGMGYGIDEKCIETVQKYWHYRPATRDGVPIPSKYDAHWPFRG